MFKKLFAGSGLAVLAVGLSAVSALAYTSTAGASGSTSTTSPTPGSTFTFTVSFTVAPGSAVQFFASGGGSGCTVTFNPATGTTASSQSTQVTLGSACTGSISLEGVAGAQTAAATITVGALPAASGLVPASYPALWLALLVLGLGMIAASVYGIGRKAPAAA